MNYRDKALDNNVICECFQEIDNQLKSDDDEDLKNYVAKDEPRI